ERLRQAIADLRFPLEDGGMLSVTMSLGVAMLEDRDDASGHALQVVDRALYAAKAGGRDQVTIATEV
ncbi:MAG: diguanylate cyclase, partial [Pseudomonadota bacterium]